MNNVDSLDDARCQTQSHQAKKDIKIRDVYAVEGYIRLIFAEPYQAIFCHDILDIVLFLYAKPLVLTIQYSHQVATVLYYPSHDTWHSIAHRIKAQFICLSQVISLTQHKAVKGGKYDENNWQSCQWNAKHTFEAKLATKSASNLTKLENQIEVLSSEAAKARSLLLCNKSEITTETTTYGFREFIQRSMNDRVVDQLFRKWKSEELDGKRLASVLTLVVIIYRVKVHQMKTGRSEKPPLDSSMIKGTVEHLTVWIIRNFGKETDQKKHVSVQNDAGNTVQGTHSAYTFKTQRKTFGHDIVMWVNKYIEMDGDVDIDAFLDRQLLNLNDESTQLLMA
eukprot:1048039_1